MPKLVNHAGGSGFAIGEPLSARAGAAEASRANPASSGSPAAPSFSSWRRDSEWSRSIAASSCSVRVPK